MYYHYRQYQMHGIKSIALTALYIKLRPLTNVMEILCFTHIYGIFEQARAW